MPDDQQPQQQQQPTLESYRFNGPDYEPERDNARLGKQFERIKTLMLDGQWRTLSEIAKSTGYHEASISAQLRHMRKERFGSFVVEREYVDKGLYRYRVLPPLATVESN